MTTAPTPEPSRYEMLSPLARGGMGELYLARAKGLAGFEKLVVVKRLLPELSADARLVQMFLDEARVTATLDHQNVVHVLDVGLRDGRVFLVMEYLHGKDVRAILARSRARGVRVPIDQALAIVLGVAAGLHHAHQQAGADGEPLRIVHRDVSPANVFVTYDGGVKVVDFGIARARNRLAATDHGAVKGKAGYMSPEQCRGEPLDRRSDVFALGILAYELLTGARPHGEDPDDGYAALTAIVERPATPPTSIDPSFPSELERILRKALEKDKRARYATAAELSRDLEAFVVAERASPSPFGLAKLMSELFPDEVGAAPGAGRVEGGSAKDAFVSRPPYEGRRRGGLRWTLVVAAAAASAAVAVAVLAMKSPAAAPAPSFSAGPVEPTARAAVADEATQRALAPSAVPVAEPPAPVAVSAAVHVARPRRPAPPPAAPTECATTAPASSGAR